MSHLGENICRRHVLAASYELDAIAAVILGGTSFVGGVGSIWGTLIGAVALDRYRLTGAART